MRHYEIVALVHPDQSDHMEETASRYQKMVEDSGGVIHRFEDWGRRKLAYPIQKQYKAGYFLLNIECDSTVKDEIENAFRYNDAIMRSLVIRKDHAVTEPSPMLKRIEREAAEQREREEKAAAEAQEQRKKEAEQAAKRRSAEKDSASDEGEGRESGDSAAAEKQAAQETQAQELPQEENEDESAQQGSDDEPASESDTTTEDESTEKDQS